MQFQNLTFQLLFAYRKVLTPESIVVLQRGTLTFMVNVVQYQCHQSMYLQSLFPKAPECFF